MGRSYSATTAPDFTSLLDVYQTALELAAQAQSAGEKPEKLAKIFAKAQAIENRVLSYRATNVGELQQKIDFLLGFAQSSLSLDEILLRETIRQLTIDFDQLKSALPDDAKSRMVREQRKAGLANP